MPVLYATTDFLSLFLTLKKLESSSCLAWGAGEGAGVREQAVGGGSSTAPVALAGRPALQCPRAPKDTRDTGGNGPKEQELCFMLKIKSVP